jgi:hypothetical protein
MPVHLRRRLDVAGRPLVLVTSVMVHPRGEAAELCIQEHLILEETIGPRVETRAERKRHRVRTREKPARPSAAGLVERDGGAGQPATGGRQRRTRASNSRGPRLAERASASLRSRRFPERSSSISGSSTGTRSSPEGCGWGGRSEGVARKSWFQRSGPSETARLRTA